MTRYWLDASSAIWCNREFLPLKTNPKYWEWLATKWADGSVVTHRAIFDEIIVGVSAKRPDPFAVWVKNRRGKWCSYGCTDESKDFQGKIALYCLEKYDFDVANDFLDSADPLLIARAAVDGGIVVTQESALKDPRIPSICDHFQIRHMPMNRMNIKLGMSLG